LTQCPSLNPGQQNALNNGTNFVNWLRGQFKKEDGVVFRDREHVLGDVVNAEPGFVGKPNLSYADAVTPDYDSFKTANAGRQTVLYIGANDGMLHAFNGSTGAEMWTYVPRMVMPELYKLAAIDYGAAHRYYVDGSPTTMDVFLGGAWKTILVAGLNSGGRGYYALDVTVPNSPKGLWEVCSNSALCSVFDQDMGLSFSDPVITKRPSDGKWVVIVTSGYNNVVPGDGKGYIYVLDAATGTILNKVTTGAGDVFTPSGFAKVSAFATDFRVDNTTTFVYGGDLLGNVFRYNTATNTMQRIAQLFDASSPPRPQPVTTRPEIAIISGFKAVFFGTGRLLGLSDLQDPATLVPAEDAAYQQTVYGIKDTGADLGNLRLTGNLVQQTLTVIDPVTRSSSTNAVDWNTKNGWYVDLNPLNSTPGERVNIEPQLVLGTLLVVTNVPNQDACTIGGESWVYQFNYQSGRYLLTSPANAIATKLGNAVTMGIVVVRLPSGQLKAIATDATGAKTPFGVNIGASSASGRRTSWRELIF
ncbi:MAG: pilus assembly protein, partial [Burkholderiales bacterium]